LSVVSFLDHEIGGRAAALFAAKNMSIHSCSLISRTK
jgi:hypothetical protein